MKYLTPFARPPPGRPDSAQSRSTESDYLLSPSPTSSRHRYSSVSTRTNDSSPTITRTVTPIPLEFSELPDPFVPKDEWAVVNVSGQRFHINMDHVKLHHPTTLLGSADFEKIYWDQQRSEYFIDRHRGTFEVISSFLMRGGSLIRPDIIPIDIFLSELTFYRLSYSAIKDFLDIEGLLLEENEIIRPIRTKRELIWATFDRPETSSVARIVSLISITAIILSMVVFCIETFPDIDIEHHHLAGESRGRSGSSMDSDLGNLFFIESICVGWFIFEFIIRFLSCPSRTEFMSQLMNIIDFIAIIPYFLVTAIEISSRLRETLGSHVTTWQPQMVTFIRSARILRAFRILKLSRYSRGLRILALTVQKSARLLFLLVFFQMVLAVTFGSVVYIMEADGESNEITSIPEGIWFAIITMTTVGYGDVVPRTICGKIFGSICAMMGILCMSFPVPFFVSHFNYLYNLDRMDCKLRPEDFVYDPKKESSEHEGLRAFELNLAEAVRHSVSGFNKEQTTMNVSHLWNTTRRINPKRSRSLRCHF